MHKSEIDTTLTECYAKAQTMDDQIACLDGYIEDMNEIQKTFCRACGMCSSSLPPGPPLPSAIYGHSVGFTPSKISVKVNDDREALQKFCPDIMSRSISDKRDDYRTLPSSLWREYGEQLRAHLLDSGRLRLNELGDPKVQLETILFLKSKGQWSNLPMLVKLGVFFGSKTKQDFIDTKKQMHEEMQETFFKKLREKDAELRFRKLKYESEEKAREEAMNPKPISEEELFQKVMVTKRREVTKNG